MKILFVLFFALLAGIASGQPRLFFQRQFDTKPLSVLEYGIRVRCLQEGVKTFAALRFYDSSDHLLLEFRSAPIIFGSSATAGYYTESPAKTRYARVTVEADSAGAADVIADSFHIDLNIGVTATRHDFQDNEVCYMQPFWVGDTVYRETVLLYSRNGGPASGNLLFEPGRILSVDRFGPGTPYSNKTDYRILGRKILLRRGSAMPFRTDSSFDKTNLAWYNLQSQWVTVTYTHKDRWTGPIPDYQGARMPSTMAKLRSNSPLRIVAYGMSITRGLDVSGYDSVAPYMPPYVDLFTNALRRIYGHHDIRLFNAALPGARVDWGAQYVDQYVNPLKPDLVIIDFGMNDFWVYKPGEFKGFVLQIIRKVKSKNPGAEFLLLSNMKFDPAYVNDSDRNKPFYVSNLEGYHTVLQELEGPGIVNLDMTTLSAFIYSRKKAKDCLSNPLHPNDYMARWYAQGMTALFRQPDQRSATASSP